MWSFAHGYREDYKEVSVPPWAIRLMLDEEDL